MKKILTVLMVLVLVMTAFSTNVSADSVHLTDEERELFQDERKQFKNAEILFKIYPNACFIGNFPYGLSVQEIASLAPFEYYIIPAGHIFTTNLYGKNQIIACPPENTYKRGRIDFFMDLYQNGEKYLKQYMKKNLSKKFNITETYFFDDNFYELDAVAYYVTAGGDFVFYKRDTLSETVYLMTAEQFRAVAIKKIEKMGTYFETYPDGTDELDRMLEPYRFVYQDEPEIPPVWCIVVAVAAVVVVGVVTTVVIFKKKRASKQA